MNIMLFKVTPAWNEGMLEGITACIENLNVIGHYGME